MLTSRFNHMFRHSLLISICDSLGSLFFHNSSTRFLLGT